MHYRHRLQIFNLVTIVAALIIFNSHCTTAQHSKENFKPIFNGKNLDGWKGDSTIWRVENNSIVGEVTAERALKSNTFLIFDGMQPGDFEMKAEFRITTSGNSGIQYRSELVDSLPYTLKGYQADIDGNNVYTGQNYEERGRGFLAKRGENAVLETGKQPQITSMIASPDSLKSLIRQQGWNEIHIIAEGNRMRHLINGVLMSEVNDNDVNLRKGNGLIGFQAHTGPPMKVEYRNITLKQ